MKMTKLLATGLAASVAVSSLATIASAEELSFGMGATEGTVKTADILAYFVKDVDFLNGLLETGLEGTIHIPYGTNLDSAKMVVTGKQGTDTVAKATTYDFVNNYWSGYDIAVVPGAVNKGGQINFSSYTEITSIEIYVTKSVTYTKANDYDNDWGVWADNAAISALAGGLTVTGSSSIFDTLNDLLAASDPADKWYDQTSKETKVKYPYILVTDGYIDDVYVQAEDDNTLTRKEIYVLSRAGAWHATNGSNGVGGVTDGNQTYDDNKLGTEPVAFAGFASQVADFFNKQTNGTITIKFLPETTSNSSWGNAGIPSTQVGIKNVSNWSNEDFALFFNYTQTGALQATTAVDVATGEVTFDISDILDQLGGQTSGVIDNIYYGLTKGTDLDTDYDGNKNGVYGLAIETVTLAYDEDAADDDDIVEDDADDDADDEVVEDDADEDDVAIDEDDADDADDADEDDVTVDEDDDDAAVDGTDDVIEAPAEDDDSNPATGVALAVVPALVAAAAAVVSKKRK